MMNKSQVSSKKVKEPISKESDDVFSKEPNFANLP